MKQHLSLDLALYEYAEQIFDERVLEMRKDQAAGLRCRWGTLGGPLPLDPATTGSPDHRPAPRSPPPSTHPPRGRPPPTRRGRGLLASSPPSPTPTIRYKWNKVSPPSERRPSRPDAWPHTACQMTCSREGCEYDTETNLD